MMIRPAYLLDLLRCPNCGGVHMVIVELCGEEHYLDVNGYPIYHTEHGLSFMRCISCKHQYPYIGNSIDGYCIDDGTYYDEPPVDKNFVTFNPFFRQQEETD